MILTEGSGHILAVSRQPSRAEGRGPSAKGLAGSMWLPGEVEMFLQVRVEPCRAGPYVRGAKGAREVRSPEQGGGSPLR